MTDNAPPAFRILSLDGGGVRGAFEAAFLAKCEDVWGSPAATYFDLVVGTSTGGIVATALASGVEAYRVREMYRSEAKQIFARPTCRGWDERLAVLFGGIPFLRGKLKRAGMSSRDFVRCKYDSQPLRDALISIFNAKRISDVDKGRLLVLTSDLARGQTKALKTPHLPGMVRDGNYSLVDALLATSAAPTYFPPHVIESGSLHVDGGLWANNPVICGVAEAMRISREAFPESDRFDLSEVEVWSIGTGHSSTYHCPDGTKSGLIQWRTVLDTALTLQGQGTNHQATALLGERLHRFDFAMPNPPLELDSSESVDRLILFGEQRANESIDEIKQLAPAINKWQGWLNQSDVSNVLDVAS